MHSYRLATEAVLTALPTPPSPDSCISVIKMVNGLIEDLRERVHGEPGGRATAMTQLTDKTYERFTTNVLKTLPAFRPFASANEVGTEGLEAFEQDTPWLSYGGLPPTQVSRIYLRDIRKRVRR